MSKYIFILICFSFSSSWAQQNIKLSVHIGEKQTEYIISDETDQKKEFKFFYEKVQEIFKYKSHEIKFCKRDFIKLVFSENNKVQNHLACIRSKTPLSDKMKNLANLLKLQYGKN